MRARVRQCALALLIVSTACNAPLILAEPRGEADASFDIEAGPPLLGERADVEESDVFVVIQGEAGPDPDAGSAEPHTLDAGDADAPDT